MRVGTRKENGEKALYDKDHPHACGDKCLLLYLYRCKRGSSPCVWGQAHRAMAIIAQTRIIPMRVGTSRCICRSIYIA